MIEQQLPVLLHIVVRLIVVEMHLSVLVGKHISARIVPSAILFHFLLRRIVPRMIGALLSGKGNQLNRSMVSIISPLQIVGIQSHRSPVNVSVGSDVRKSCIERPMVINQSASHVHGLLMRIKRTIRAVESRIRLHRKFSRLHVDARPESTCTIGRSARSTLHLHILHRRSEVRQIHPEHRMALRIVDWNPIGRHIDSCPVGTSHPNGGIADTCPRIAGGHGTGSHAQQIRQVLPKVLLLELLLIDVGKCHRSSTCGTC